MFGENTSVSVLQNTQALQGIIAAFTGCYKDTQTQFAGHIV